MEVTRRVPVKGKGFYKSSMRVLYVCKMDWDNVAFRYLLKGTIGFYN